MLAGLLFWLIALPVWAEDCSGALELSGDWGWARFDVELALDPESRARGLMHREALGARQGMLFVYPRPGHPAFWMKNTLIALDMLFIGKDGVIRRIKHRAQPGDLTPVDGGPGVLAVLEIRGGLAATLGVAPGDRVQHPAFTPAGALSADWPCEVK
ncbi:MAG: hypothetical protein CR993_02395 [Rhodobacterales bacterium]|nr:MAG: hypothetical protein CR993_02395 [Rhodobacterales bacterium]